MHEIAMCQLGQKRAWSTPSAICSVPALQNKCMITSPQSHRSAHRTESDSSSERGMHSGGEFSAVLIAQGANRGTDSYSAQACHSLMPSCNMPCTWKSEAEAKQEKKTTKKKKSDRKAGLADLPTDTSTLLVSLCLFCCSLCIITF